MPHVGIEIHCMKINRHGYRQSAKGGRWDAELQRQITADARDVRDQQRSFHLSQWTKTQRHRVIATAHTG